MIEDPKHEPSREPAAKIFISYSRRDMAFVDRVAVALKSRGFEPMIDRSDIYAFENWWQRIQTLIGRADTVVFVISPGSIDSEVALKEVNYADSLNKRFAPIVYRQVETNQIPEPLRRLNFIYFDSTSTFDASLDALAKALQTDIEWVREHTRLGEFAERWARRTDSADRATSLLLRGAALAEAELWISRRPKEAPEPSTTLRRFVIESRTAEQERAAQERRALERTRRLQKLSAYALFAVGALVIGAAIFTVLEARDTERREAIVLTSISQRAIDDHQYDRAMRIALQGLPSIARSPLALGWSAPEMSALEAKLAGAAQLSPLVLQILGHRARLMSAIFSPGGRRIVAIYDDDVAAVWGAVTGKQLLELRGHGGGFRAVGMSADGERIVTGEVDGTVTVWNATSGAALQRLPNQAAIIRSASFGPDGRRIVTSSDNSVIVWDSIAAVPLLKLSPDVGGFTGAVFDSEGVRLATSSNEGAVRIWDSRDGKKLLEMRADGGGMSSVSFSKSGDQVLAVSDETTIFGWNSHDGTRLFEIKFPRASVSSAAFSPDGRRIVASSVGGIVSVWSTDRSTKQLEFKGHQGVVTSAEFNGEGTRIVSASEDGECVDVLLQLLNRGERCPGERLTLEDGKPRLDLIEP